MLGISKMAAAVQPSATLAAAHGPAQGGGPHGLRLQPRRAGLFHPRAHSPRRRRRHEQGPELRYTPANGIPADARKLRQDRRCAEPIPELLDWLATEFVDAAGA